MPDSTVGRLVWSPEQMDRVRRGVMSLQEGEQFTAAIGDLRNAARDVLDIVDDEQIDIGSPVWDVAVERLREAFDAEI